MTDYVKIMETINLSHTDYQKILDFEELIEAICRECSPQGNIHDIIISLEMNSGKLKEYIQTRGE